MTMTATYSGEELNVTFRAGRALRLRRAEQPRLVRGQPRQTLTWTPAFCRELQAALRCRTKWSLSDDPLEPTKIRNTIGATHTRA
jgi:hypothetical protein